MKNLFAVSCLFLVLNTGLAQNFGFGTMTPQDFVSIGTTSQLRIDSFGNIRRINNIPYSFPSVQGNSSSVLMNNGSGSLTWGTVSGGGSLTGTGINTYLTKWTGSSTLGNSLLFDNGTNVAIGTAYTNVRLSVISSLNSGMAIYGYYSNTSGSGIHGETYGSGSGSNGVEGLSTNSSGSLTTGVFGKSLGSNGNGVYGECNTGTNAIGVWGMCTAGLTSGYAGYFGGGSYPSRVKVNGNLIVTGTVSKASGSFMIDHPLDPANKYLYHSFVESPDMMNIYNGNITTNDSGEAIVGLPDYFIALNVDFKYQLTTIGQFSQVIVLKEVDQNNTFVIKTEKPYVKVSWQITGVRNDAYAKKYPIITEVEKGPQEKGYYLHPDCFGFGQEKFIDYRWLKEKQPLTTVIR